MEIGYEVNDGLAVEALYPLHLQHSSAWSEFEQLLDLFVGHYIGYPDAVVAEGHALLIHLMGEAGPFIELGGDIVAGYGCAHSFFSYQQSFIHQFIGSLP